MNNQILFSLATSVIPILAISFVCILIIYKIYIQIRSKFNTNVNCWFCNQNAKVPYLEANSWTCPHCEQYNGFTKDGDYNREIFQQFDCSNVTSAPDVGDGLHSASGPFVHSTPPKLPPQNGFCSVCNEAQRLKVEKLAQFEPKNESRFDEEFKAYKEKIEDQYRLCATCDRHLSKVLREKKKMVLGSKFLDFIIKGAETLKQPHFSQLRHAHRQLWKRRCTIFITALSILNLLCLSHALPTLSRDNFTSWFGEFLGHHIFIVFSHTLALGRVISSYFQVITTHGTSIKLGLFCRTLFMMLLYSLGLKLNQLNRLEFVSLYVLVSPFVILGLCFGYNIVDSFKLTRYTFLLLLWSSFAGGLIKDQFLLSENVLMFLASLFTMVLSYTSESDFSAKSQDTTANSFHKIYSDDYLSDDETMSLLSRQLNCSSASMRSMSSNCSFHSCTPPQMKKNNSRLQKSPLTSSMLSLNRVSNNHFSPTSKFKSFCLDDNQSVRSHYAASMCNYPTSNATTYRPARYASNLELNSSDRPHSTVFGWSGNTGGAANASYSTAERYDNPPQSPYGFIPATAGAATHTGSLYSPLSVSSSNALYQQRSSNLLSPTRFSTTSHNIKNTSATTSWLSGGYFNQRHKLPQPTNSVFRTNFLYDHRNGLTGIDENLSRASSQSSGFESQNGRLNISRENSLGPDVTVDTMQQRTMPMDNAKSFQPIDPNYSVRSPSLLTTESIAQPLSVDCPPTTTLLHLNSPEPWKIPSLRSRPHLSGRDSFNLRKINEELPRIKRGDLLRKWKEGQTIS